MRGYDNFIIPPVGGIGPDVPPPPPPTGGYAPYATPTVSRGIPLATPYGHAPPLPYHTAPPAQFTPYNAQIPLYTPSTPYHKYKTTAHYSTPPSPYHGYGFSSGYAGVQPPSPSRYSHGHGLPHVYDYHQPAYAVHEHGNSPFIPPYRMLPEEDEGGNAWHRGRKSPRTPLMRTTPDVPVWDSFGSPWGMLEPLFPRQFILTDRPHLAHEPVPHQHLAHEPVPHQPPQISTLVAAAADNVRVVYDLRYECQTAIFKIAGTSSSPVSLVQCFTTIATNPAVRSLRIVCPEFPWVITVAASTYAGVSVGDILQTTYKELQKPVSNSEWWIASESVRERVLKSWHESLEEQLEEVEGREGKPKKKHKRMLADVEARRKAGIKRVDWVREKTMWGGLVGSHPVIDERASNWGDRKEVTYALLLK